MDRKLICCMIGDHCSKTIKMSVDSILPHVDKLYFIWGGYDNDTKKALMQYGEKVEIIKREYETNHPHANSNARNFYLDLVKKNHKGDWCIVMDPDEVMELHDSFTRILRLGKMPEDYKHDFIKDVPMVHFIGDLAHEDSTKERHDCLGRIFLISDTLFYPNGEHPVLNSTKGRSESHISPFECRLWHLAYCANAFDVLKRYKNHLAKSEIHSKEYLRQWYLSHLMGQYPRRDIDIGKLPKEIKKHFMLENISDEIYYANRKQMEAKHFILAKEWIDHFNPSHMVDVGCGMGHFVNAFKSYGVSASGFDINEYAIKNTPHKDLILGISDIVRDKYCDTPHNLTLVLDILEHLDYDDLDKALRNIKAFKCDDYLFMIPFVGDPDLENDPTHIIKETREWWEAKLKEHGFKLQEVPEHFSFRNKIIIAKK